MRHTVSMRIIKYITEYIAIATLALAITLIQQVHAFQGEVQRITLHEQTQIAIKLVPDLGTRLIFPFILDDPQLKPPLNYKLTNTRDFTVARTLDALIGQNVFLVTTNGRVGAVGKLYISIAGYHLALNLGISNRIDDHISDIYFNLTEEDRQFLIANEIANAKSALEASYQRRLQNNKEFIDREELAKIINYGTKHKNIKKLFRGGQDSFATADIYLDKFIYRKPSIYAMRFWVEHYSSKFITSSILVQIKSARGDANILEGRMNCFDKNRKIDECLFVTTNSLLISNKANLTITLTNDKDEIFIINY